MTAIVTGVFYSAVIVPIWLVLGRRLNKLGLREPLVSFHAFALTWILTCFLFFVRKYFSKYEAAFDAIILIGIPALCYFDPLRRRPFAKELRLIGQRLLSGRYAILFSLIIVPLLFFLIRLGNEVVEGAEVVYYGQLYIDFGVLKGITNLLVASDFMPESFVYGTGPLSYHWLFFAVPAWNSDLLGCSHDMNGVLSIANYVAAIFLYRCLSHAISLAIRSTGGRHQRVWSDLGAAVVLFGMNLRYFHEAASSITGWAFLDPGERNGLLLSLSNSVINFGNITFAVSLLILVVMSLHRWTDSGNRWYLWLSCLWVGCTPMLSATTVPGIAIGIGLACLLKWVRSPWYSLACFAAIGLGCTLFFRYLGAFDSQSSAPRLSWDGGQFLKNCVFASPLFVLPFLSRCNLCRGSSLWGLGICVSIGLMIIPSLLTLGHMITPSDLSMKNYTALAAVVGVLVIGTLGEMVRQGSTRTIRYRRYIVGFLIVLGAVNSSAYAMSSLMMRYPRAFGPIGKIRGGSRTAFDGDYFRALRFINQNNERSAVLLAEPSTLLVDPTSIVAGNRTFLPNAAFLQQSRGKVREQLLERDMHWVEWKASGFNHADISRWFADRVELLLVDQEIRSSDWAMVGTYGKWRIYSSVAAKARMNEIAMRDTERQMVNRTSDHLWVGGL